MSFIPLYVAIAVAIAITVGRRIDEAKRKREEVYKEEIEVPGDAELSEVLDGIHGRAAAAGVKFSTCQVLVVAHRFDYPTRAFWRISVTYRQPKEARSDA